MELPSLNKRSRIFVGAIDSMAFCAPFVVLMAWKDASTFTGDVGLDRSLAACMVLVVSLLAAYGVRRTLGLKD